MIYKLSWFKTNSIEKILVVEILFETDDSFLNLCFVELIFLNFDENKAVYCLALMSLKFSKTSKNTLIYVVVTFPFT